MSRRSTAMLIAALTVLMSIGVAGAAFAQYPPPPADGEATAECSSEAGGSDARECRTPPVFRPNSRVDVQARGYRQGDTQALAPLAAGSGTTILAAQRSDADLWVYETTVTADENGVAVAIIPVPDDVVPPIEVTFSGVDVNGDPVVATAGNLPASPPLGAPDPGQGRGNAPEIAATGSDFTVGAAIAVGALVLGGAALMASRRRSTTEDKVDVDA